MINGQKAWATNGGIADVHVVIASVDRELGSRGHAAFVIPPGTKGCEQGAKVKKHGLRASHTADVHLDDCRVPGACLLGGKEKLDERLARVREGKKAEVAGGDADLRGEPADGRRPGARHRPRRLRVRARVRQRARAVRPRDHREPVDRLRPGRHEAGDRRRPPARLARRLDGPHRPEIRKRRGLDVEAEGRRGRRLGRPSGRSRSSAATATPASSRSSGCTATRRSTRSSRAPPRSSAWSSPARSPASTSNSCSRPAQDSGVRYCLRGRQRFRA